MNEYKLAKYETMAHREGMLQRFKETCFWDYCERPSENGIYTSHAHFYTLVEKSVGKNAQEIFDKLKANPLYKKHNNFKRELDELIRGCTNRVNIISSYYYSPHTTSDFYVDVNGLIQTIESHPLYKEIDEKLKVRQKKDIFNRNRYFMVRTVHEHLTPDIIVEINGKYYYAIERGVLTNYEVYSLSHAKPGMTYCSKLSPLSKKDLQYYELV